MPKSFYDLDYIIEINEKRLEQYTAVYKEVTGKLSNILIIYSAITFFIIPIIKEVFTLPFILFLVLSFIFFLIPFLYSLFNTIQFLIPVKLAYLREPNFYYTGYRKEIEREQAEKEPPLGTNLQERTDNILKASYILELEDAVKENDLVFKRKTSFYYRALVSSLIAVVPFLLCLGYNIFQKDDKITKVPLAPINKIGNLHKK